MMKQLLEQFLSEALSAESIDSLSQTLEQTFTEQLTESRDAIRLELATQFAADREALSEAIDTMVRELLAEHVTELKDDISSFRDLEVEYANRLAEAKKVMAENLEKDMANLVENLDGFVEERLTEHFNEHVESINELRKNQLGLRIFEQFRPEVEALLDVENGNESIRLQLEEANKKIEAQNRQLAESANALSVSARSQKLTTVLAPLHGRPREIMEAVLTNIPTEKLDEAYAKFIPSVLNESVTKNSEKDGVTPAAKSDSEVLAEGKNGDEEEIKLIEGVVVSGDDEEGLKALKEAALLDAANAKPVMSQADRNRLRKLAGL